MLACMGGSFASVILSYFLVAGGTFFAILLAGKLGIHNEYIGYLIMAAGAFLGGVVAARASRGSTIVEPAVGSIAMVGSLVVLGIAVSDSGGRDAISYHPMGSQPIVYAVTSGSKRTAEMLQMLLAAGADPNPPAYSGMRLIQWCRRNSKLAGYVAILERAAARKRSR